MGFRSRRDELELQEARKAGLAPAEVDDDGNEINPHIPKYMSSAPWYLNGGKPSLKHQRKWKPVSRSSVDKPCSKISTSHDACENCGGFTHDKKSCVERPRKLRAKTTTTKYTAPDENLDEKSADTFELSYDAKRDRWNGYDAVSYKHVVQMYEARDEARTKYLKLEQRNNRFRGDGISDDDQEDNYDDTKVDESKQMDFARVEKRGGSTGTVRNLRLREDTAKYLLNLDLNSAYYHPKTRSMRQDPLPDVDPNHKFYAGDNFYVSSGQALEFKQLNSHVHEAFDKGHHVHMQAAPSQAELLYNNFKINKDKLKSRNKDMILDRYGNAATEEEVLPRELLLGQSEREVEYDRAGRLIKGNETAVAKSKYEEDVYMNNHTSVWGSWWNDRCWGYTCCHQIAKNSYCTGAAGIEAAQF